MAGFIKLEVEKLPVQQVSIKISSEILEKFQRKLKQQNIPMNVVLTVFVEQYVNGKYSLDANDILKWNDYDGKTSILSTSINKEAYNKLKDIANMREFLVRHIFAAFVEDYAENNLVMELVKKE